VAIGAYDLCLLTPSEIELDVVGQSIEAPRSLAGTTQAIDFSGGGFVIANYSGIQLITSQQHLYWNKLAAYLNGSVNYIAVPLWTDFISPAATAHGVDGTLGADAAVNAGQIVINFATAPLVGGEWFMINHGVAIGQRAYRISDVISSAGTAYTVSIRPTLREAETSGHAVVFWRPSCRMRLAAGETMPWSWGAPGMIANVGLNLVEAF